MGFHVSVCYIMYKMFLSVDTSKIIIKLFLRQKRNGIWNRQLHGVAGAKGVFRFRPYIELEECGRRLAWRRNQTLLSMTHCCKQATTARQRRRSNCCEASLWNEVYAKVFIWETIQSGFQFAIKNSSVRHKNWAEQCEL